MTHSQANGIELKGCPMCKETFSTVELLCPLCDHPLAELSLLTDQAFERYQEQQLKDWELTYLNQEPEEGTAVQ